MIIKGRIGGVVSFQSAVLRGLAFGWLLGLSPVALLANPTGGTVVAGSATVATSGSTLNVTTGTNQTIINWNDFSIGNGETTNIWQPNSSSTTLNRVTGGNVSAIYGTLNSNGNVILVNPNGVLVGAGGVVNTQGSFLASTLNLTDRQFLHGHYHFTGTSGASITNLGQITSGGKDVFLIAQHVANSGTISAVNGTVGLAAGNDVRIARSGDQRLSVALDSATVVRAGTGVDNEGTIAAVKAELVANGNIYSLAVNNGGIIRATGAGNVGGQVWLLGKGGTVKNTGTITAKNADGTGGQIETSGDSLSIAGTVLTGKGGRWLLDPADLVIDASLASTAAAALENGTNVDEQATNSITLDSAIAWSGNNGGILTLDAGSGTITLNASITTGGTGGVVLSAGGYSYTSYTYGTYTFPLLPTITYNNGAAINLASTSSLTIQGHAYVIVNSLDDFIAAENAGDLYVALGSNVVATHSYTSTPIPSVSYSSAFSDGLGHTITGFTLVDSTSTNVGLFGIAGWVSHLGLVDASITALGSHYYVGSLVGTQGGCYDCYVTGSVTATGDNTWYVGGIAGSDTGFYESHAAVTVTTEGAAFVGGLVGGTAASIANSYATGNVTAGGANDPRYPGTSLVHVGGLVGDVDLAFGEINSSYATGNVSASNTRPGGGVAAGGLVGSYSGLAIAWSHATGNVTIGTVEGVSYAGGLVGIMGIEKALNPLSSAPPRSSPRPTPRGT